MSIGVAIKNSNDKRPRADFNKEDNIVTIYCTPELFQIFSSMSGEKSGANEMLVLLKAIKQIKELMLKGETNEKE